MGRLDAITGGTDQFGLYVAGPDGSVIIDGTSDMFRIAATGGVSLTGCNGSGAACTASAVVTLSTGLTYSPAHLGFMGAVVGRAETMPRTVINNTAGGGTVLDHLRQFCQWVAGDQTEVTISWETGANRSANTYAFRWYIMEQASV